MEVIGEKWLNNTKQQRIFPTPRVMSINDILAIGIFDSLEVDRCFDVVKLSNTDYLLTVEQDTEDSFKLALYLKLNTPIQISMALVYPDGNVVESTVYFSSLPELIKPDTYLDIVYNWLVSGAASFAYRECSSVDIASLADKVYRHRFTHEYTLKDASFKEVKALIEYESVRYNSLLVGFYEKYIPTEDYIMVEADKDYVGPYFALPSSYMIDVLDDYGSDSLDLLKIYNDGLSSKKDEEYYDSQIKKVIESGEDIRFQLKSDSTETKWINLNSSSAKSLIKNLNDYNLI